jgi:hypothetical protein
VGYPRETKGYYFYNKTEGKVFVAHNGVFLEKEFLSKGLSGSKVQLEEIQETLETVSAPTEDPGDVQDVAQTVVEAPAPRRSILARRATSKLNLLITEERHVLLMENDEPMTYIEAIKGPNSDKWLEAMESELNSMHDNQVWNLVDPIEGVRPIDCKWIFKKNLDMDGNVHIYKSRLVAKGFRKFQVLIMRKHFRPSQC